MTNIEKIDRIVEELREEENPALEPDGYPLCAACENCPRKVCNCEDCTPWREWFKEAWEHVRDEIRGRRTYTSPDGEFQPCRTEVRYIRDDGRNS